MTSSERRVLINSLMSKANSKASHSNKIHLGWFAHARCFTTSTNPELD